MFSHSTKARDLPKPNFVLVGQLGYLFATNLWPHSYNDYDQAPDDGYDLSSIIIMMMPKV